jgi:hypothetical protein
MLPFMGIRCPAVDVERLRSRELSLNLRYQRTHSTMIYRSKCRLLKRSGAVILAIIAIDSQRIQSCTRTILSAFRQPFAGSLSPHGGQAAPQSAADDSEDTNEHDLDRGMCTQQYRHTKPFSE